MAKTKSGLLQQDFEGVVDGKAVKLAVLSNKNGAEATILNYGAKIVSLMVPDKDGKLVDVVLGHNNLKEYLESKEPSFGAVCGRTANRIAKGKFILEGKEYNLAINNGPNSLHGGLKGFNAVVWDMEVIDGQTVKLAYKAKDGEEGYPGNLLAKVTYHLTDDNELEIKYKATSDKTTIINLTNHSYFNLSGAGDPNAMDHLLTIYADKYLPTDATLIPYGEPEPVQGTPFDFTSERAIGANIGDDFEQLRIGNGYDHCFVFDKKEGEYAHALTCISPKTGIQMDAYTTEPGVQLYTASHLTGDFEGKQGHRYPSRSSVCFETQHFPDAVNKPEYPTVVLKGGDQFRSRTVYKFSVKK